MPRKKKARIGLQLPKELRAQLEHAARQEERPLSAVIRRLLLRALAQNEKTA